MDSFILAGKVYRSRLLVGTGKYRDMAETRAAIEASGAEIVTVAIRRMDLSKKGDSPRRSQSSDSQQDEGLRRSQGGYILDALNPKIYTYLPNSAGCHTAEEAVRTLRLARALGEWSLVKLEIIGNNNNLYPNIEETLKATKLLVRDGFHVMAYTNDDPLTAKKLEEAGCVAVMPLASPIGSGLGIINPAKIRMIVEQAKVPVLVDAGIGTASDACIAMELGCAGVLLNTAIAAARDPVMMAQAMKHAVIAGRQAYLAGRMQKRDTASPSSPVEGIIPALVTGAGSKKDSPQ